MDFLPEPVQVAITNKTSIEYCGFKLADYYDDLILSYKSINNLVIISDRTDSIVVRINPHSLPEDVIEFLELYPNLSGSIFLSRNLTPAEYFQISKLKITSFVITFSSTYVQQDLHKLCLEYGPINIDILTLFNDYSFEDLNFARTNVISIWQGIKSVKYFSHYCRLLISNNNENMQDNFPNAKLLSDIATNNSDTRLIINEHKAMPIIDRKSIKSANN